MSKPDEILYDVIDNSTTRTFANFTEWVGASSKEKERSLQDSIFQTLNQEFKPLREETLRVFEVNNTLSRRVGLEPLILAALIKLQTTLLKVEEQQTHLTHEIDDLTTIYNATIYDLNTPKYKLSTSVQVVIVEQSDETVAKLPELNLYAVGDSPTEAIYELKQEIIDLYEDLTQTDNKLGPLPESWLRTLRTLIVV